MFSSESPPVGGTGGDNHSPRGYPGTVLDLDGKRSSIADQFFPVLGNHHLGAELLGLGIGPSGEFLARDSSRKAKIVLDPRAGPGLTSRRVGFQHQNIEPFGCTVDGRRKAGGTCPHYYQVADSSLVERFIEAQTVRNLPVGRVPKDELSPANQYRHVVRIDVETIQKFLHPLIMIEIDEAERMAVARQEVLDSKVAPQ